MAKGPESAEQCRLHSLGIQRDRELSRRAHMLQKEPERTTIQSTAEEHKRQEYMSKHSSVTARKKHFQSNLSLKFEREPLTKSSISDHFWPPFGPLDPFWEGSGSQRETERILDTIFTRLLVDLGSPWVSLWIPFGRKTVKNNI